MRNGNMQKRVFLIHGWSGSPRNCWFPWLARELEQRGFTVAAPALPEAHEPRIANWIPAIAAAVGAPDGATYFVGHSMGCQAIARYAAALPEGARVGGAVFVAGFLTRLTDIAPDERGIADEWLETPFDRAAARARLAKSIAIFSDNDRYVPLDNSEAFVRDLGSKIVVERAGGHFTDDDGATELPAAFDAVLEIAGEKQ